MTAPKISNPFGQEDSLKMYQHYRRLFPNKPRPKHLRIGDLKRISAYLEATQQAILSSEPKSSS